MLQVKVPLVLQSSMTEKILKRLAISIAKKMRLNRMFFCPSIIQKEMLLKKVYFIVKLDDFLCNELQGLILRINLVR